MAGARAVLDGRVAWLSAIALVAGVYTWMAFDMEWRTAAGRIGPGFFPRIIGGLTVALCIVAIVRHVLGRRPVVVGAGAPRHGPLVAVAALALLGYLLLFEYLGAALASVVFLVFMLSALNRGVTATGVAIAVLLPAALYVLFEVVLGAALPPGPLPAI